MTDFDRRRILDALRALDIELGVDGLRGEIFVVGGAAMALAYDERRATADVDAVFAPTDGMRRAAARVGERFGLEPDWLNDAVKAFLPGEDTARITVYDGENLGVAVASPRFLLAMKLLSSRADRVLEDIKTLYRYCGFTTADEGLDLVAEVYPEARIPLQDAVLSPRDVPRARTCADSSRGSGSVGRGQTARPIAGSRPMPRLHPPRRRRVRRTRAVA